jgi:protein TonB
VEPKAEVRPQAQAARPAPVAEVAPAVSAAVAPPPPVAPEVAAGPVVPAPVAAPPGPRAEPAKPTATGAPQPAEKIDRGLLERYGLMLSREIGKDQRYPKRAQMLGWQGTTEVLVRMTAGGAIKDVKVEKSSGYPVLDEEAVAKVKRAKSLPPPPEGFRGREFTVLVPIVFRLE